jgi:hypothetical protein
MAKACRHSLGRPLCRCQCRSTRTATTLSADKEDHPRLMDVESTRPDLFSTDEVREVSAASIKSASGKAAKSQQMFIFVLQRHVAVPNNDPHFRTMLMRMTPSPLSRASNRSSCFFQANALCSGVSKPLASARIIQTNPHQSETISPLA